MNTTRNNPLTLPLAAISLVAVINMTHAQDNWVRQSPVPYTGSEMQNFESIAFLTTAHGFISGSQSFLLETIDGDCALIDLELFPACLHRRAVDLVPETLS